MCDCRRWNMDMGGFALNIVWAAISILGGRISKRSFPSPRKDAVAILLCSCCFALWIFGPSAVTWGVSTGFIAAWFAFSTGIISRRGYLLTSAVAAAPGVPALFSLGATAFAMNEIFGMGVGLLGALRIVRNDRRVASYRLSEKDGTRWEH